MTWSHIYTLSVAIVEMGRVISDNDTLSNADIRKDINSSAASNQTRNELLESIFVHSMEDLCLQIGILIEDCSCEKIPDLCPVEEDLQPIFTVFPTANLVLAILTTLCLLFGIVGNSDVLAMSCINSKKLTKSKKLIAQMAFIDLSSSIVIFMGSVHHFWTHEWILGVPMCKVLSSLIALGALLPIGYILIIAFERFFGIIYPLRRNHRGNRVTYILVGLNLICGIGTIIPLFFAYDINEQGVCAEQWPGKYHASLIFNWFLMLFYFIVPVTITMTLYIIIMRSLSRQLQSNQVINREDIMQKRIKSNRRTMTILISILVAFVVCVLPTRVSFLYVTYRKLKVKSFDELKILTIVNNLTYPLHVVINPIIYSVVDRDWRNELFSMLHLRSRLSNVYTDTKTSEAPEDSPVMRSKSDLNDTRI